MIMNFWYRKYEKERVNYNHKPQQICDTLFVHKNFRNHTISVMIWFSKFRLRSKVHYGNWDVLRGNVRLICILQDKNFENKIFVLQLDII